jgi:hypothetical protein
MSLTCHLADNGLFSDDLRHSLLCLRFAHAYDEGCCGQALEVFATTPIPLFVSATLTLIRALGNGNVHVSLVTSRS